MNLDPSAVIPRETILEATEIASKVLGLSAAIINAHELIGASEAIDSALRNHAFTEKNVWTLPAIIQAVFLEGMLFQQQYERSKAKAKIDRLKARTIN